MLFRPVEASRKIAATYRQYLLTTFGLDNEAYARQFAQQLAETNTVVSGPYLDISDAFTKDKTIADLVAEGALSVEMLHLDSPAFPVRSRQLYFHQVQAIKKVRSGHHIVVSTGTGSGKTESFVIPILDHLLQEKERGKLSPGVRALLIYPMNALANDQIARFREILGNYTDITFGCYTGETANKEKDALASYKSLNHNEGPLINELISRERMRETPPHILITNYAMLEFLMIRPGDRAFFAPEYSGLWKYVVLDEAHVYNGSTGIEVTMLLRRLRASLCNDNIQFILTSATLGDEDANDQVAAFASELCGAAFPADDVIRGVRSRPQFEGVGYKLEISFYHEAAELIRQNADDGDLVACVTRYVPQLSRSVKMDADELLYDVILRDQNYHDIRSVLESTAATVESLAVKLGLTDEQVTDFVAVTSRAAKNGDRLFEARYHMFLRAIEGAYITLSPNNRLFLARKETHFEEGQTYKVFEIATCNYCHSIYLLGRQENGRLIQASTSLDQGVREIYLLKQETSDENDDLLNEDAGIDVDDYYLCAKCGALGRVGAKDGKPCDCGGEYLNRVIKVKPKDGVLHKCVVCESINSKRGVLRSFFAGQEAVTSVIGTALYEEIPGHESLPSQVAVADEFGLGLGQAILEGEQTELAKQFIAFSDSRQAAAYFASYFDQTYTNMLYKHLVTEAVHQNAARLAGGGVPFHSFINSVQSLFEKHAISDPHQRETEAWKAVLTELYDISSSMALQNLGIVGFVTDIKTTDSAALGLKQEEMAALFNVLADNFRTSFAICYPFPLTRQDKEFFTYNGLEMSFSLTERSDYVRAWNPARPGVKNSRFDFVKRVIGQDWPEDKIKKFLETVWELFRREEIIQHQGHGQYKLDCAHVRVVIPARWYHCPKCHTLTMHNVRGVCPSFKCQGQLVECNPDDLFQNNHYREMFLHMHPRRMSIVEHTAQLNRKLAYRYQNEFKDKRINILSCSTTFEMGVDVGTLETVFMRNMPPTPANYAQRAGRAGRSKKAAAYALTFCNKSSHDFSYYREPLAMIKGRIKPPRFNIHNEKIAIRHIYASAFAFFWRSFPQYFNDAGTLLTAESLAAFRSYLEERPQPLKDFLGRFLPGRLAEAFAIADFGWARALFEQNGPLAAVQTEFQVDHDTLAQALREVDERIGRHEGSPRDYVVARRLKNLMDTIDGERILSFLSRKNLIPKYGFPVDTVELQEGNIQDGSKLGLRLQRDLMMAISEYAPASQIVADNKLITSRYVKKVEGLEWDLYDYALCSGCNTLNIERHTFAQSNEALRKCRQCGLSLESSRQRTFLIPKFGFIMEPKPEKVGLDKPERTYRGEVFYVGYGNKVEFTSVMINAHIVQMGTSANDELAVLNEANFFICPVCGYGEVYENRPVNRMKAPKHVNPVGYSCKGAELNRYALGHRFKTDVVQVQFPSVELSNYDEALSILYGLLEGISRYLDIERTDISGCLQWYRNPLSGNGNYALILFDATPGGAGHVRRINEAGGLEGILRESLRLLEGCTCGGEEMDSSCYSCLRNYYNQKQHDQLKRRYAVKFLRRLVG